MEHNKTFFTTISEAYEDIWDQRDKRMDGYLMLKSPLITIFLCSTYVILSLYVGPWYMKNRKPYNVKKAVVVFNVMMVLINGFLHIEGLRTVWLTKYKFICEPVDTSNTPEALYVSRLVYYYYITKFIDWIDTLFFLMRKKFNHVSVLHIYHHTCMPLNTFPVVRFLPGGHLTFAGMLNTLVHVIMHTYYALSALGPKWQKYLWWKKHITRLQIAQFITGLIHLLPILHPACGIPRTFFIYMLPQAFIFLSLFANFYRKAYNNNNSKDINKEQ